MFIALESSGSHYPTKKKPELHSIRANMGERRDLNPRPPEPQSGALPTELRPPYYRTPNL